MLFSPHHDSSKRAFGPQHGAGDSSVAAELRYLVRSAEPAVVFSSLAHLCVPAFSDACVIDIVEQGDIAYRIVYCGSNFEPADTSSDAMSDWSVSTPFASTASGQVDGSYADADYAGVMTHRWVSRRLTVADQARAAILARHCVAAVTEERHRGDVHRSHAAGEQLHTALPARRSVSSIRPGWGCRGSGPVGTR